MRNFFWTYLASIGEPHFYRYVFQTQRLRAALWYYVRLVAAGALVLAGAGAAVLPGTLATDGAAIEEALRDMAPDGYAVSITDDATITTTLPEPLVIPREAVPSLTSEARTPVNALVVDTSTSTASSTRADAAAVLTDTDTLFLLSRNGVFARTSPVGADEVTAEHYTLERFAGATFTHEDISSTLTWPGAHQWETALIAFFAVGVASVFAGLLLLIPLAVTAVLTFAGAYIAYPHATTYIGSLRATLHATTLPLTATVVFALLPLPPFSVSVFLMLTVFLALLNVHRALREERREGDMDAEK